MNRARENKSPRRATVLRFLLPAILAGSALASVAPNPEGDEPVVLDKVVVAESKTHTLFMGADIAVSLDKGLFPVQGVIGSSWVVDVNGRERVVSAKGAPINLQITPNLKLTNISATITGYKKAQAYSFKNDPSAIATRALDNAALMNADLLAVAQNAQHITDTMANKALGAAALFAAADTGAVTTPNRYLVQGVSPAAIAQAQGFADGQLSQAQNGDELGGRLVQTGLDALEVEFEISSARPLQNPYLVTMARFHPKGTAPGTVQNLVYARELHPIDAQPNSVHFIEEGFPLDFELLDFQLHIYNRGEEVATSLSTNRAELTRDEAFQYVKIEYVGSHKGDTLPAVPVMAQFPSDLPKRLAQGEFSRTFFVKVSRDGLAEEAFADSACTRKIEDSYLEAVVRSIRFKPALAKGEPVDGIASLELARLKI